MGAGLGSLMWRMAMWRENVTASKVWIGRLSQLLSDSSAKKKLILSSFFKVRWFGRSRRPFSRSKMSGKFSEVADWRFSILADSYLALYCCRAGFVCQCLCQEPFMYGSFINFCCFQVKLIIALFTGWGTCMDESACPIMWPQFDEENDK